MDATTIERIKQAHPKLRNELLEQYKEVNNQLPANVRLRFAYVYRTPEEQHVLFLQTPKVTKADSWQSIHNYSLAFDIVLLYDKNNDGTFETASWEQNKYWMQVVKYFVSKGWEWGGSWKTFKDAPHFQYKKPNGESYKWQELKFKIANDDYIVENGIKYVNI
jgi:peptidoglycan L-alanyl-D-glutamate endopeptidase CwlK